MRKPLFLDDAVKETDVVGKCCDYESFLKEYDTAVAALGDNNMRLYWTEKLMEAGYPGAGDHPSVRSGKPKRSNRKRQLYHAECRRQHTYDSGARRADQQRSRRGSRLLHRTRRTYRTGKRSQIQL